MANISDKELMGDGTNSSKETYPPECKEPAKICPIMSFKPKTGETGSVLVRCFGHECMAWNNQDRSCNLMNNIKLSTISSDPAVRNLDKNGNPPY